MDEIIIRVAVGLSEKGWFFDIFENESELENDVPIDGGLCTTTIENALDMAVEQAKDVIRKRG